MGRVARALRGSSLGRAMGLFIVLFGVGYGIARIRVVERQRADLMFERDSISGLVRLLRDSVASAGDELETLRCALGSSAGINAYHDGDYALAIDLYDDALGCDPADGYVLNLKAYSLFKSGDLDSALEAQRASVRVQPDYAWGYFNLARFLCANSEFEAAAAQLEAAVALLPELAAIAATDGEFQSLCEGTGRP